jgi:hypothetical protein
MQSRAGPLEAVINFNLGVALMFVSVGKLKTANHKRGVLAQPTGPLPKPGCLVATGRDCGRNLGRSKASQHAELWLSFVSALAVPTKNFPLRQYLGAATCQQEYSTLAIRLCKVGAGHANGILQRAPRSLSLASAFHVCFPQGRGSKHPVMNARSLLC